MDKAEITIGTEKQITWATEIKAQLFAKLESMQAEAIDRVANGSMPTVWLETINSVLAGMVEGPNGLNSWPAAKFIATKNQDLAGYAFKVACGLYAKKNAAVA